MRIIVITATTSLMLVVASCDAYNWPPYENQLYSMFLESKSVLTEIEAEMIADGLSVIGPGPRRQRHGEPKLTETQVNKYKGLFEELPYHWNMSRHDGTTFINVYGPRHWGVGKDFYYSLVHRDKPGDLPSCDAGGWTVSCGMCSVPLGDNWSIDYSWNPRDIGPEWDGRIGEGLPTPEEIQEQYRQELDECMDAGLTEMGSDSGEA